MCVCSSQRFGALVERVGRWNMERKEIQGDLGPERAVFVGILNKKKPCRGRTEPFANWCWESSSPVRLYSTQKPGAALFLYILSLQTKVSLRDSSLKLLETVFIH